MTTTPRQGVGFRHEAFFYADDEEFLAGIVPFVEEGVAAGGAVLVGLPLATRSLLEKELDPGADDVRFLAIEEVGRNPSRLVSAWIDFLGDHEIAEIRGISEAVWPGRSAAEIDECQRHERLLNLAFDDGPAWTLMCPYDTGALSDDVLSAAAHDHEDGATADPLLEGSLPPPSGAYFGMPFGKAELREVRRLISERAATAGLDTRRTEDLVLATCEAATNSVQHGGGEGDLRVWYEDGALLCDVRDAGRIEDPLVGRERPSNEQISGRGLWIANQLCDLVQIRSGKQGTQVRLRMAVDPS
ncbi:MAG: anti-sigma factor RsbA family regulatory protein [Solirubrobacterales bacterium]